MSIVVVASSPGFAASPQFVDPVTISTDSPFILTAVSPSAPYKIDGFSGGVDGLFLYKINNHHPSLRPAMWRTQPGKTIAFKLLNNLPCTPADANKTMRPDQTNVHVHGLIVRPNPKNGSGTYGDNVMLVVDSTNKDCPQSTMPMGDHPHEKSGSASFNITLPVDHPYGLSWYHPHVHEVAGYQVGSGMSGLIAIGNVWSYAYTKFSSKNVGQASEQQNGNAQRRQTELALRQHTKELHLMLKDLQLKQTSARPLRYTYNTALDTALCGTDSAPNGVCSNAAGDAKWLFMVNGQVFPTITINNGDRHVWRMANVGATVSYKLHLRVTAPAAAGGTIIPLQVLVSDGVAFPQLKNKANWQKNITMMPSARTEVHVDPMHVCRVLAGRPNNDRSACTMAQDVEAVLETKGIKTGADAWPDAGLAQVKIKAIPIYTAANDPGPMGVSTVRDNGAAVATAFGDTAPPCANPSSILPTQYRLIGVKNETRGETEFFGMATKAGVFSLDSAGRPSNTSLADTDYQSFDANRVDLCVGADIKHKYTEHWVIKNDATEIHNFHVHQSKFKVIDYDNTVTQLVPMRTGKDVYHDNFPINPGQWIMIEVAFYHQEQVGKFVYHCHILEHEDKGMMSVIQVVDTSAPAASAVPIGPLEKVARVQASSRATELPDRMPIIGTGNAAMPVRSGMLRVSDQADGDALTRYRASVPPWMADSICLPDRAKSKSPL